MLSFTKRSTIPSAAATPDTMSKSPIIDFAPCLMGIPANVGRNPPIIVNYVADLYRVPKADREERLNMFLDLFRLRFAVDRQIKSYSHGMKQKICIIAALIYEPKLWVLDEPMMGLDPQSTAEILSYMREHVRKGNTVFFSSHNLDMVAKVCNRVAIINDGILHCVIDLSDPANRETLEKRFFEISSTEEERRAWNV